MSSGHYPTPVARYLRDGHMDTLWLGYDDLALPYREIAAVLLYQPALDARIVHAYGRVPRGVRSVVVTAAGAYLPARVSAEQLRRRWAAWRQGDD